MGLIQNFINYYMNQINTNQEYYKSFMESVNNFNINFSDYVQNNIMNKSLQKLNSENYQYNAENQVIIFNTYNINNYTSIQPVIELQNEETKTLNKLHFNITLNMNNTQEEFFAYLTPYQYDEDFQIFSHLLHLVQFYLDNNTLNNFFQVIHFCHQDIINNLSTQDSQIPEINSENQSQLSNDNLKGDIEEELDDDILQLQKFAEKYMRELNEVYPDNIKIQMIKDQELFYLRLSDFLQSYLIGKNFKYENLIETLEKYTEMFDAVHNDKQIYLAAHYYQNFTIRPILEYSYLKEKIDVVPMITIDFVKFEISYFNKHKPEDSFDTTITIIPYKKDKHFELFLSLFTILLAGDLSLFHNPEDENKRFSTVALLPFFYAFSDEVAKVIDIMRNPMKKRHLESKFLDDNRNYNERDLDKYIEE